MHGERYITITYKLPSDFVGWLTPRYWCYFSVFSVLFRDLVARNDGIEGQKSEHVCFMSVKVKNYHPCQAGDESSSCGCDHQIGRGTVPK